ncbi:PilZ domain-containing protein [bacterium]|nr:PilZ domain-containing protein [bacterium]
MGNFKDDQILSRPERRNYERLDTSLDVEIVIEGKRINTTATNLSCGGLFLPIGKAALKERTDMEVILSIPNIQKPVKLIGEVARIQNKSFFGGRPEGVGIQFTGLYDDNMMAIDKFIKNNVH